MSVQKLQVLLFVMTRPDGVDQGTIMDKLDLDRSATSKNIADLSRLTSKKTEGPDLLRSDIDPMNRVSRIISLTEKGRALSAHLKEKLG